VPHSGKEKETAIWRKKETAAGLSHSHELEKWKWKQKVELISENG